MSSITNHPYSNMEKTSYHYNALNIWCSTGIERASVYYSVVGTEKDMKKKMLHNLTLRSLQQSDGKAYMWNVKWRTVCDPELQMRLSWINLGIRCPLKIKYEIKNSFRLSSISMTSKFIWAVTLMLKCPRAGPVLFSSLLSFPRWFHPVSGL